jgi:hypothetical protein
MAKSGTITKAIRTGYQMKIVWTVGSQSAANNTSSVTVKVQLVSTGASYTINSSASKSGSLTINGTKYTFSFSASLSGNQTKTLFTKTVTVAHSADGSKTCSFASTIGIKVTLGGTYYGDVTASGSGTFDTIPRATTPTLSASSVNMGSSITINMPRASSAFTHTLTYKFGNATGTIGSGLGTSKAWDVPLSFASQIPSGTSGTCTITCKTYNGNTLIGTKTVSFKANVPAAVVPTISTVSITETVSGLAVQFGAFVQGKSKVKIGIVAAGAYGSIIKAYKTTVDGKSYTGAAPVTGTLSSGTKSVTITVTDSRGRMAKATKTLTVIAYAAPVIRGISAVRCLADGTENYDGTHGKIGFGFNISPVSSQNTSKYTLEYKARASSEWIKLKDGTGYTLSTTLITAADLNVDSAYDVRLTVKDYFTTVTKTVEIPTAFTLLDFNASGRAMAFGKVSELTEGIEFGLPVIFRNGYDVTGNPGWITAKLTSDFETYAANAGNTLRYKKIGGVVYLKGVVTPKATLTGGTDNVTITTLPEGYRPEAQGNFICQGSGTAIWLCTVTAAGLVRFARYRNGSAWADAPNNTWLPIDISFII